MQRTLGPLRILLFCIALGTALVLIGGAVFFYASENAGTALPAGDEAYIDLLFARNLADGTGPRYLPDHPKTWQGSSALRSGILAVFVAVFQESLSMPGFLLLLSVIGFWLCAALGTIWLSRHEGEGAGFLYPPVLLSHGGLLWLLVSGHVGALAAPLAFLCTFALYDRDQDERRIWIAGVSGCLLGLSFWPGYAYAIGTSAFLWIYLARKRPALRDPFRPLFWVGVLPLLGGGLLLLCNWMWTGHWSGGGPLVVENPLDSISLSSILRLEWIRGLVEGIKFFGSLGTSSPILSWLVYPLALYGAFSVSEREAEEKRDTGFLPVIQFSFLLVFTGFLPSELRRDALLAFYPVFLIFLVRGISRTANAFRPGLEPAGWILIAGIAVVHAWQWPSWQENIGHATAAQYRNAVVPAREARESLADTTPVAAADDPTFLWHLGPDRLQEGFIGSGYRMRIDLAGRSYAGVRRDGTTLLLDAPQAVVFPAVVDSMLDPPSPDFQTVSAALTSASYTVAAGDHSVIWRRPADLTTEALRDHAVRELIRAGREADVLWSIAADDLVPAVSPEQRFRWWEWIEDRLSRNVGEAWYFEAGYPDSGNTVGEGVQARWSVPAPYEGFCALTSGGPERSEPIGTYFSKPFTIEGDEMELAVAGIGSVTESFVALLVSESVETMPPQPVPVQRGEHFYHYGGHPLRGSVFYYLVPSDFVHTGNVIGGWRVVRFTSTDVQDSWNRIRWPIRAWRGKTAMWILCDRSAEAWIALDAVRQSLRPPGRYWDFEEGTYSGWTVEGEAFGEQPVVEAFPGQQPVSGEQGDCFVNSFLNGNDEPQGTLKSAPFPIDHEFLRFRIGGGDTRFRTALNLYVDGQLALSASGERDERLRPVVWDLRGVYGREGQLEIVDHESGSWGHILVDDIALVDEEYLQR